MIPLLRLELFAIEMDNYVPFESMPVAHLLTNHRKSGLPDVS